MFAQFACLICFQGFEHLLQNLGLGRLVFEKGHSLSLHKVNGSFQEVHDSMRLHRHSHKRSSDSSNRKRRQVEGINLLPRTSTSTTVRKLQTTSFQTWAAENCLGEGQFACHYAVRKAFAASWGHNILDMSKYIK